MEGSKVSAVLIVALVVVTNINHIIAKPEVTFVEPDSKGKAEGETSHELKKLESCVSKCKPEETQCAVDCVEKSLGGAKNFKLDETKFQMAVIYKSIFCLVGCTPLMEELCDKKDADACKQACETLCVPQKEESSPAPAPKA